MAETKLNNIWLNERKISANISKYKRREAKRLLSEQGIFKGEALGEQRRIKGALSRAVDQGPSKGFGPKAVRKSFTEVLKAKSSTKDKEDMEACKSFIFDSSKEDRKKFENAKVAVMHLAGLAYGVSNSLIEEGIFSIQETQLGPNLCLLEESVEGDSDLIMNDG